ncbi:hypothetical protein GCM10023153_00080 [Ornithinibacter aureus]|uniref:Uncharacterized protein n=1 Tax=Ornithinibacter aureus TaxID=622664 RepID=A0ABP8J7F2_9MICO|nr:hypothetical protein [Ornithinibacter aureus]KAF0835430.1 hypothetical protein C8E84_3313 [Ornithinibacter aureus]
MSRALLIPTPDGSGQMAHPDVVYVPGGFAGFPYLMACTPYPFGVDRFENPCLRVSDDGVRWQPLPGAPDPVVPAPTDPSRHWSDTDLSLVDGVLHLVFRGCVRGAQDAQLLVTKSRDGIEWTEPTVFHEGHRIVSPALVHHEGRWSMWHVEADSNPGDQGSRLVRTQGPELISLREPTTCPIDIPGHRLWHVDVVATDLGWEALCAAYPERANASRCALFHAVSADGLSFRLSQRRPVLRPRAGTWSSRVIYRATLVKSSSGYRVWYSGGSWAKRWGVGLAEGPIGALRPVPDVPGGPRGDTLLEGLRGRLTYMAIYRTPAPVKRALRAVLPG